MKKGEARSSLARAVFFNRLGEIRDRNFEQQRYRASGLNLVTAVITFGAAPPRSVRAISGRYDRCNWLSVLYLPFSEVTPDTASPPASLKGLGLIR